MAQAPAAGAPGAARGFAPADALVLRLAFAAAFGFAIAILLKWEFSFLAPMLAVQILAGLPVRPSLGQGLAIPIVTFVATNAALFVCSVLVDAPAVLMAVVGLVICWSFYAQRRGAPAILMLLAQIAFCGVPLMSSVSLDLAHTFADFLQRGTLAAVVTVWTAHALFPAPPRPPSAAPAPKPVGLPPDQAGWVAISDTLVLLPLLVAFMLGGDINNFVVLMSTINLVSALAPGGGRQMALGLLVGNTLGGVVAVVLQQVILMTDTFLLFLLTVMLAALVFGARMARGGPAAAIFALALATFLLLIGLAITPLPGGSEEAFILRILKIGAASLYALGTLSLLARLRRTP